MYVCIHTSTAMPSATGTAALLEHEQKEMDKIMKQVCMCGRVCVHICYVCRYVCLYVFFPQAC